jgi:hypothetical protein
MADWLHAVVMRFHCLLRISLPPISILKVRLRTPSGHTVVQVKQKMHSVERIRLPIIYILHDIDVHVFSFPWETSGNHPRLIIG